MYIPLDQRSETTTRKKKTRKLIAKYQTMYHSLSLVYRRILPRHFHLLLQHHHRRILYLTSADTPKIPQPKELEVRVRSYGETRWTDLQKPKGHKNEGDEVRAICYMNCRIGCNSSENIWLMNVVLQSHGETLSLDIETLPALLMNYQWRREQKWNGVRVNTVSTRTFRRTQIAISA